MSQATLDLSGQASVLAGSLGRALSAPSVVRASEPLAKHTTLRIGGPADLYVEPGSEGDLVEALRFAADQGLPVFVLGRGSNLLVRDGGFRGLVVCLAQPWFSRVEAAANTLTCGAGARLKTVAVEAKRHELGGLEFLEGIPGSVGGGLRMNAGAMGGAFFDVVVSVRMMSLTGSIEECTRAEMSVDYRSCATLQNRIALSAVLRGNPTPRDQIERKMEAYSKKRWASQPAAPSAGCMFKNPAAIPAGKLIDELGLKDARIGGARISQEHGNFLVNDGSATARDVFQLIELIKARARSERGIELETEVEIIGTDA